MRCIALAALSCVLVTAALGQNLTLQEWTGQHFGLSMELPITSWTQNFQRVDKGNGTFSYEQAGPYYNFNSTLSRAWQDAYALTNSLPNGSTIRVGTYLWQHYPEAVSTAPRDYSRYLNAILERFMFRGYPDLSRGLNVMFVHSVGIPPSPALVDGWAGDPRTRDWYLPLPANRPALRRQFQDYIYSVNGYALDRSRQAANVTGTTPPANVLSRISFQLGNEVGGTHPGGPEYNSQGHWTGIGQVMQDTTAGLFYRASNGQQNSYPGGAGLNTLIQPAFSFLTEGRGGVYENTVSDGMGGRRLRSFEHAGALVPGLNEIFTYYDEMTGPTNNFTWASQCTRRAVHFRSPGILWTRTDGAQTFWPEIKPDGSWDGGWETPQQFAVRWVDDLAMTLKGYLRLPMPGQQQIIDFTEAYLTYGELRSPYLSTNNFDFTGKTEQEIRDSARALASSRVINGVRQFAPPPPSRIECLAAIRDELYTRHQAGLLPGLGRIIWTKGYSPDPRRETGFGNLDPITFYNPFNDFRLTPAEVRTLFGVN